MLHRIARALGFVPIASVPTLAAVELAEASRDRAIERAREADEHSAYWGREAVSLDAKIVVLNMTIAELNRLVESHTGVLQMIVSYETPHAAPTARKMAGVAREGLAA